MKKLITLLIVLAVLFTGLFAVACNPIVSCDIDIPQETLEAVNSEAKGLYSNKLPLVPVYVKVSGYSEGIVYYTVNYFPFGSVGMSYSETDGYNTEKPLSRLS